MAKSTVLNEFFNVIKFKTDQSSLNQAHNAISGFKRIATGILGTLGVGLSLSWLRGITEEFSGINDEIRGATEGLGEQADIQKQILASAQECRESYGKMAGYVTDLVQKNTKLFPVDDAVKFTSLIEKLEKGSGKESSIGTTMSLLSKSLSAGKVDKTVFSQLTEKAPEVVKVLEEATGKSKTQLQSMAAAGTLTADTIKKAILSAEDSIEKKFGNVDLNITDAVTHIRNSWGYWFADLDSTYKITDKISRAIIDLSDKALDFAKKIKGWLDDIAKKLDGYDKVLKLIAMAAAAVFIATNAERITAFLKGALGLLGKINLQTTLSAAKWLALFLIIEDIWTFFQGGDSVIGRFLSDAGVDVDKLRENVSNFFQNAKQFGKDALSALKGFWDEHGESIVAVLQWIWQGLVDLTADIITLGKHLFDLLSGLITGFQTGDWTQFLDGCQELWQDFLDVLDGIGEAVFGDLWTPMKESAQELWDWLTGFFSWIGDKISGLSNAWNNFKSFISGGSSTDDDGFGGSDGGNVDDSKNSRSRSGSPTDGSFGGTSGGSFSTGANAAWKAGTAVSPKTVSNSSVSSTKNYSIKQENNQQYTFQVTEQSAADRLRNTVDSQQSQSAIQLSRALNYGR